ncbi:MAG: small, acid-soluble spore protein, alpha/beta type [Christensenellales bacterium]
MANSNNRKVVPEAQNALDNMKYEIASQIGVNLKKGYNGDLTAQQNGSVGGEMTKRLVKQGLDQK